MGWAAVAGGQSRAVAVTTPNETGRAAGQYFAAKAPAVWTYGTRDGQVRRAVGEAIRKGKGQRRSFAASRILAPDLAARTVQPPQVEHEIGAMQVQPAIFDARDPQPVELNVGLAAPPRRQRDTQAIDLEGRVADAVQRQRRPGLGGRRRAQRSEQAKREKRPSTDSGRHGRRRWSR